jgi:hypothetical protein
VHQYNLNLEKYLDKGGQPHEDYIEDLSRQNKMWRKEAKYCEKVGCKEGDVHHRLVKHRRYRLRSTIVDKFVENEELFELLLSSCVEFFFQEIFRNNRSNEKRKMDLIFDFSSNLFVKKILSDLGVEKNCCNLPAF